MKNIDYTKTPLVKKFIELNSGESKSRNHIFLYAGGGYGKTTAMKCLYLYLVSQAKTSNDIVPIYIDVKELNFRKSNPIISYIHSEYSGVDTTESDVENLFKKQAPSFSKKYTYCILIDGLNETGVSNKIRLMDDISEMNKNSSNISFIISSRIKEDFDKISFNTFQLKGFDEDKIKNYLDEEFGKRYNENTDVKKINKSLIEILKIPMFMNVFSKTYNKKSPYPDIYTDRAVRKADILDSYIQKILNDLKERTDSSDNDILEFVINYYLPALAFQMVENNTFIIEDEDVDKKLNLNYFLTFFRGTKKEKIKLIINSDKFTPISICNINFALINDNEGNYSFVHQIWRDFFAAKHIINCMNAEKLDALEVSVDGNVRQFIGELVREYDDEYKYSKKPDYDSKHTNGRVEYVYSPDTRRCECDFETKDNLDTWPESPIEHFMQENYKELNTRPIAIRNLNEIMKTARNNHITAKYDCLNLIDCDFTRCNLSNSRFNYTSIYENNFISEGHKKSVNCVFYINNGENIVSCGDDGNAFIWDIQNKKILIKIPFNTMGYIYKIRYNSKKNICIMIDSNNVLSLWKINEIAELVDEIDTKDEILDMDITTDGNNVAVSCKNTGITIWEIKNNGLKNKRICIDKNDGIKYSAEIINIYGNSIIFCIIGSIVKAWNIKTGKPVKIQGDLDTYNNYSKYYYKDFSLSKSQKKIVLITTGCDIYIFNFELDKEEPERIITTQDKMQWAITDYYRKVVINDIPRTIAISEDGNMIAIGAKNIIWLITYSDISCEMKKLEKHTGYINNMCFSSNGSKLCSCDTDGIVYDWNIENLNTSCIKLESSIKEIFCVTYSHDNRIFVCAGMDKVIRIFDAETCRLKQTILGNTSWIRSIAFSPDDKYIATVGDDKMLWIWDISTHTLVKRLVGHDRIILSVDFSKDGEYILTCGLDCTIKLWKWKDNINTCIRSYRRSRLWLFEQVKFLDEVSFLSCSNRGIELWSLFNDGMIASSDRTDNYNQSLASVGNTVISVGTGDSVTQWEIGIPNIIKIKDFKGHVGRINSVDLSSDSKIAVTAGNDGTVRIWDVESGREILEPLCDHEGEVLSVKLDKTANKSISVGKGKIIQWEMFSGKKQIINVFSSNIVGCNFSNAVFLNNSKMISSFIKSLYYNGADVPKEYEPKTIPFEWNSEETINKELE